MAILIPFNYLRLMRLNRKYLKVASGFAAAALVLAPFFIYKSADNFENLGYLGFFIANYLGFGVAVLPALIKSLNPILLILVGSVGVTIDEYFAWYSGSISEELKPKGKLNERIEKFVKNKGLWAIFILALIPFPDGAVYAVSGFAAGFYRISFRRFFLANFLGKLIRTTILVLIALKIFT
ncbi:MAG: VTT domain-containing protein [Patescibacteria group bacterium]